MYSSFKTLMLFFLTYDASSVTLAKKLKSGTFNKKYSLKIDSNRTSSNASLNILLHLKTENDLSDNICLFVLQVYNYIINTNSSCLNNNFLTGSNSILC